MQTHYPIDPTTGSENSTLTWVQGNPATGTLGSYPPYQLCVNPQTELINLIVGAGLVPTDADMTQVLEAVRALIAANTIPGQTGAAGPAGPAGTNGTNAFEAPFLRLLCGNPGDLFYSLSYQNVTDWSVTANTFVNSTFSNGVFTCGTGEQGLYLFESYIRTIADSSEVCITLFKNGQVIAVNDNVGFPNGSADNVALTSASAFVFLVPGDQLVVQFMQWNSNGNGHFVENSNMNIIRIPN